MSAYPGAAMSPRVSRAARWAALAAASAAVIIGLSGCFTGERPTLADGPVMTGDAAVDAVLQRLDATRTSTFTAGYDVLTRFGDKTTAATVVQAGPARRSITVGHVRFIVEGADIGTCDLDAKTCSTTLDAARISDTQLAPDFYATSAAIRLRRDSSERIGPTVASTATIAGQQATCVAVPVTARTETYCALDGGPLARLDAGDLRIEMTSWSATPDDSTFAGSSG
jgi:hypothetical protein